MAPTKPASAKKKSRSVSPSRSRGAASSSKPEKKSQTPKSSSKKATPRSSRASAKKRTPKESEMETQIVITEDLEQYFSQFLLDMLADSTALHNVLRLQYLQCYAMGLLLLASSFSLGVSPLPMFQGASNLVQAVAGCLGLAQAFSLTATAQTSYSAMKKALQYNMLFHLLFAFVVIVHQDATIQANVQMIVAVSCLNVGINMWACYFRETTADIDDEAEDLASDAEEE